MDGEEYNDENMSENRGEEQDNPPPEEEMTEEEKFFNDLNNEEVDRKDPSLGNYLMKIYEEEVPFEIREDNEEFSLENGTFESLLCKIFTCEDMNQNPRIKIEIGCDKDLFFYYSTDINSELFESLKETQNLTCDFDKFSDLIIEFFDNCIKDTKKYLAVFTLKKDGKASMELLENLEHKFGELISLVLNPASDDMIRKQIIYRYNAMRAIADIAQNRIDIINGVLKDIDPQLIDEVKKDVIKVKVDNNFREKPLLKKH